MPTSEQLSSSIDFIFVAKLHEFKNNRPNHSTVDEFLSQRMLGLKRSWGNFLIKVQFDYPGCIGFQVLWEGVEREVMEDNTVLAVVLFLGRYSCLEVSNFIC